MATHVPLTASYRLRSLSPDVEAAFCAIHGAFAQAVEIWEWIVGSAGDPDDGSLVLVPAWQFSSQPVVALVAPPDSSIARPPSVSKGLMRRWKERQGHYSPGDVYHLEQVASLPALTEAANAALSSMHPRFALACRTGRIEFPRVAGFSVACAHELAARVTEYIALQVSQLAPPEYDRRARKEKQNAYEAKQFRARWLTALERVRWLGLKNGFLLSRAMYDEALEASATPGTSSAPTRGNRSRPMSLAEMGRVTKIGDARAVRKELQHADLRPAPGQNSRAQKHTADLDKVNVPAWRDALANYSPKKRKPRRTHAK